MTKAEATDDSWTGPVPVSMLSKLAASVLDALRRGDPVAISRRGEIVAVITPTTSTEAAALVDLDDPRQQLSSREFQRGNVSAAVDRAARGERLVLTFQNRPLGLLRPAEEWQLLSDLADPALFGDPTAPLATSLEPGPLQPTDPLHAVPPGEPVAVADQAKPRRIALAPTRRTGSATRGTRSR